MDWRKEWKSALLSGNYPQLTGSLRSTASFCCLGVLCDIATKNDVGNWEGFDFEYDEDVSSSFIPENVLKQIDFPLSICDVRNPHGLLKEAKEIVKICIYRSGLSYEEFKEENSIFLMKILNENVDHTQTTQVFFSALNDAGATFEEIAQLIDYL